jgi:hypothetical protein
MSHSEPRRLSVLYIDKIISSAKSLHAPQLTNNFQSILYHTKAFRGDGIEDSAQAVKLQIQSLRQRCLYCPNQSANLFIPDRPYIKNQPVILYPCDDRRTAEP